MPFSLDPELSAVLAAMAGDTTPEPLAPGDWKTWRDTVAALYPALTADLDRPEVGRVDAYPGDAGNRDRIHGSPASPEPERGSAPLSRGALGPGREGRAQQSRIDVTS
ncbi:hypothetical protein ACFWXA_18430 [Streptomyces atroolivaceus]|uniref:hypothetical protein n=1 Tax=Streptomyces atroolivaceus TaxID=66869 RepID=UPI00364C806E